MEWGLLRLQRLHELLAHVLKELLSTFKNFHLVSFENWVIADIWLTQTQSFMWSSTRRTSKDGSDSGHCGALQRRAVCSLNPETGLLGNTRQPLSLFILLQPLSAFQSGGW